MYFGRHVSIKENAARRERQDLVLLSQEMEARHQELLRQLETFREKLKAPLSADPAAP